MVYDVPLTGTKAPTPMGPKDVAAWGQSDAPTDATALFPADSQPKSHDGTALGAGDYRRATVAYINASGRQTNMVGPGRNITTAEYDRYGNTVRTLAPQTALWPWPAPKPTPSASSNSAWTPRPPRAQSAPSNYRTPRYSAPTAYVNWKPAARCTRCSCHTPSAQRTRAPSPTPQPSLPPGTSRAASTTKGDRLPLSRRSRTCPPPRALEWNSLATLGRWLRRVPPDRPTTGTQGTVTKTVDDPKGLAITRTTRYDGDGRPTQSTMPKSGGADAGTTLTDYYTATGGACSGRPEWAGLPCHTRHAAPADGGANRELPDVRSEYDRYGNALKVTEAANGATRTLTTGYDSASRTVAASFTSTTGTPVPPRTFSYDSTTGRMTAVSAESKGLLTTYDSLGRRIAYTDADGAVTTTAYDRLDRPTKVTDSAPSTTTYSYDTALEPRGLPTSTTDSQLGTISAAMTQTGRSPNRPCPVPSPSPTPMTRQARPAAVSMNARAISRLFRSSNH